MAREANVGYRYDGTLDGLLCCIFTSYSLDEIPAVIADEDSTQMSLYPMRTVETRRELAKRVSIAIHQKISPEALLLVRLGFLTCLDKKESHILHFVRYGFEIGARVMGMVSDPRFDILYKAVNHLRQEQHLYKGFIRFSDCDGVLVSEIEPKNYVLPLIATHFAGRYSGEAFMIYDKTHQMALLGYQGSKEIVRLDSFTIPAPSASERRYRLLWKQFYKTIAVEGRENPRCRMTMMPKRYWGVMTEFLDHTQGIQGNALPPVGDPLRKVTQA